MLNNPDVLQKLTEIKAALENLRSTAFLPALIGMLGVLAGSIVTGVFQYLTARRNSNNEITKLRAQLHAEIITKQRQEWMDSIREAACELLIAADTIYNGKCNAASITTDELTKASLELFRRVHFIELKLNPLKLNQQNIIISMRRVREVLKDDSRVSLEVFSEHYLTAISELKAALNLLFNDTWRSIKSME